MHTLGQLEERVRRILFENSADRFTEADIFRWLNDGYEELWKTMRTAKEDFFVKRMLSTDSSVFLIDRTYDPSSLQIQGDKTRYDLPPDFISLKYLVPISDSYKFTKFFASDMSSNIFDYLQTLPLQSDNSFVFDIVGTQLVIAPTPASTIDIEIGYVSRFSPMRRVEGQSSGTCSIVAGSTAVVGVSSKFTYAVAGQRLVPGTVDVNRIYPYITVTPTDDLAIILSGPMSNEAISAGTTYVIDDCLLDVMADYSKLLVDYAVMTARQSDKAHTPFKETFELFQRNEMKTKESNANRHFGTNMVDPYLSE